MDWSVHERAVVEGQYALIVAQYGERLDDAGRAVILARLLELQRQTAAVRRAALTAADEPLPVFRARPAAEWAS